VWIYAQHAPIALWHTGTEYVQFMVLLASLFVISGGVLMDGDLEASPLVNTAFLGLGSLMASVVGTTGASMLLIRPLLHTNSERKNTVHTFVFFIFLVSNIGGCLTPLGDPPLFLGYLQGVPFTWTFRLFWPWLLTTGLLLAVFFVWDSRAYRQESPPRLAADRIFIEPITIRGKGNLVLLLAILASAAFLASPWREVTMVALAIGSLVWTSRDVHRANHFSFHPILEVAVVFLGIFSTMIPALDLLRAHGGDLGVREPWQFFWATGARAGAAPRVGGRRRSAPAARGHQPRRRLHGGEHLHRERPELHGAVDCREPGHSHAWFRRLHGVQRRHPPAGLRGRDVRVLLTALRAAASPAGAGRVRRRSPGQSSATIPGRPAWSRPRD
jgi:hypothetical protein